MQCNTIQYNTIQYNTLKYITIQCNAMQYNTLHRGSIPSLVVHHSTTDPAVFVQHATLTLISSHRINHKRCRGDAEAAASCSEPQMDFHQPRFVRGRQGIVSDKAPLDYHDIHLYTPWTKKERPNADINRRRCKVYACSRMSRLSQNIVKNELQLIGEDSMVKIGWGTCLKKLRAAPKNPKEDFVIHVKCLQKQKQRT